MSLEWEKGLRNPCHPSCKILNGGISISLDLTFFTGHSSSITRYSPPKPVELFHGLCGKGHPKISLISVAAGRAHSMALTDCGLYVWGSSKHGQLGLGSQIFMAKRPTLLASLAKVSIVGIAAGNYHR